MNRKLAALLLALPLLIGCAGPNTLARRSEEKLPSNPLRAWELATRALDKEPGNVRAQGAAAAAARSIAGDWQRRIRALADVDSVTAAEQVLEFAAFRARAVRYATVPVEPAWSTDERQLRLAAARIQYQRGVIENEAKRPKKAWAHFADCDRFIPAYRDAARQATRAMEKATTRVAFVPLRAETGRGTLGREVAASWRGEVVERMAPPAARFTRILPSEVIERELAVADLDGISRDKALRLARRAGADRVVWGTIGGVDAKNSVHFYTESVVRRIHDTDEAGNKRTRWVSVPVEVVARVRDVTVDLEYEVMAARGGATLARRRDPCTMSARAVWTATVFDGDLDSYALYSDELRSRDPERCRQIEAKWKAVAGEGTTLRQVIEARRAKRGGNPRSEAMARWIAGAAFVMLEELPSTDELAYAALARGWKPVHADLKRLDEVDEVDLGLASSEPERR